MRSCVRPVDAARMAAGPNALRGSGPNPTRAFEDALTLAAENVTWRPARAIRLSVGSGLSPPGFQLSTALLDSDNRCSFYATTQGELRVTHRFIADTALLDSDDRCFFDATARGEQRWYAAK